MSIAWTPIRLSMSASSSRTSSLSDHVNAVRTNKLSATPTATYRTRNYCGEDYLRQQETVLEKQTVRITPPSNADGPKSTLIIEKRRVNGYGNVIRSPNDCSQNSPSSADGHYFLDRSESNSRLLVDKECQTDEFEFCQFRRTTSSKSTNMDDSNESSSNELLLNANDEQVKRACDEVDNYSRASDLFYNSNVREAERIESKDREIEHIDVVVNESRYTSGATDDEVILNLDPTVVDEIRVEKQEGNSPEVEGEEVKSNGFLAESEIEVQRNENSELKEENKHLKEDEDDDSCCVNCLYISLNICDCVIV